MMSLRDLARALRPGHPWEMHLFDEVESTMTEAQRLAGEGASGFAVAIAESQTAGTGRHDRPWHSPAADGLWMTALLRPSLAPGEAPWLTLGAAVAVAEALGELGLPVGIKWPNDVLAADTAHWRRKLCGIRAEMQVDDEGRLAWASVGIGLNVHQERFPDELAGIAASLRQLADGAEPSRAVCAGAILNRLESVCRSLESEGFGPLRERWCALALGLNEEACVSDIEGEQRGIVRGMDEQGRLLLEVPGERALRPIIAGDLIFPVPTDRCR